MESVIGLLNVCACCSDDRSVNEIEGNGMKEELKPKKKFLRKRLLINQRVQLGIILYASFFGVLGGLESTILGNLMAFTEKIWPGNVFLTSVSLAVLPMVFFLLAIIIGFYFSNRIAGPIYNIEKHMLSVVAGNKPPPIRLRQNDYFQELAASYAELLKKIPENNPKKDEKE